MNKFLVTIVLTALVAVATSAPQRNRSPGPAITTIPTPLGIKPIITDYKYDPELEKYQNEHANYKFAVTVKDGISGQDQERQESRNGVRVTGYYKYSDEEFMHYVSYVADQDGFRIVKSENIELAKVKDLWQNDYATVDTEAHGKKTHYTIQKIPVEKTSIFVEPADAIYKGKPVVTDIDETADLSAESTN